MSQVIASVMPPVVPRVSRSELGRVVGLVVTTTCPDNRRVIAGQDDPGSCMGIDQCNALNSA